MTNTATANCNPRRFVLHRLDDVSGVSGTGVVAAGVKFSDGVCVLRWRGTHASTAVYRSLEDLQAIHGHQGRSRIRWIDDDAGS